MKSLVGFIILLLINFSRADVTGVYDIWQPEQENDDYLILAFDGRVLEADRNDLELIKKLYTAKNSRQLVEFDILENYTSRDILKQRGIITDIKLYSKLYSTESEQPKLDNKKDIKYTTTSLTSMSQANYYFNTMRTDTRDRSQCYNRAMVWVYELWKYHNFYSIKNWMFFTRRYIREYNYYWWFHVTPATYVNGVGAVALDRKFMRRATPIVEWKNYFMRNNAPCPLIGRYSSYRNNQESAYCYWIRTNMYFWQPYHIENLERGHPARNKWINSEINTAYGDAL